MAISENMNAICSVATMLPKAFRAERFGVRRLVAAFAEGAIRANSLVFSHHVFSQKRGQVRALQSGLRPRNLPL